MSLETKSLIASIKDSAQGIVTAVFATTGVTDLDGDWTLPGAFGNQKVAMSPFGHSWREGKPPIGKGTIHEKGDQAIGELKVFMGMEAAREQFEVIKEMGDLLEWSYAFTVLETGDVTAELRQKGVFRVIKKTKVHEVSPVLIGAGVGTGTLTAKQSGAGPSQEAIHAEYARLNRTAATQRRPFIERAAPPEPAWRPALEFALDHFCLGPSRSPIVKFFAPRPGGLWDDDRSGAYDVDAKTIYVRDGLSDEETRAVIFHEAGHHFENLRGHWPNEEYASLLEHRLIAAWERRNPL